MGAGVIGVTAAYYLARDGHEVTVVDRQPGPAEETSFANAGLVAPGHAYAWASPKAPKILLKSLFRGGQALRFKFSADPHMWAYFVKFLGQCTSERARINTERKLRLCRFSLAELRAVVAETGVQYDGRDGGLLYFYRSQETFERGAANCRILIDNGQPLEIVDRDRAAEIDPALAPAKEQIAGALYAPDDESGDAHLFTRALAEVAAAKFGVTFAYGQTIQRIASDGRRIEKLVTDKGELSADTYVLSLGCDSPIVGRWIGLKIPLYPVKGYSVTFPVAGRNGTPTIGGVDEDNLFAYAPMGERLRLTATAEFSGYDRGHRPADFAAMLKTAKELFPEACDYGQPDYWAGLRPMTPEGTPIFGPCRYENLVLNTGQGHMGWTMACGSARIIADLVGGRAPPIPLDGMTLEGR